MRKTCFDKLRNPLNSNEGITLRRIWEGYLYIMTVYLLKSQKAGRKPLRPRIAGAKPVALPPKCSSSARILQYLDASYSYLISVVAVSITRTAVLRATVTPTPRLGPPEQLLQLRPGQVALRSLWSLPPQSPRGQKFGQYLQGSASVISWVKQKVTSGSRKTSETSQLIEVL